MSRIMSWRSMRSNLPRRRRRGRIRIRRRKRGKMRVVRRVRVRI